ncbi:MAG: helix-turn-helix domain-containing protein, partial [Planctomycetaceae bacterium]|nr:helix-turn-helix domain-containing protein [Planctomycetaceae bacterium]
MGKKYLSLDEAADMLGVSKDEMLKLRDDGSIKGFADRGDVKFREEDVEEFLRSQQVDSSPDFPILSADTGSVLDDDDEVDFSASDSDVR